MEGDAGTSRLNPTSMPEPGEVEPADAGPASESSVDDHTADGIETRAASRLHSRGWVVAACLPLVLLSVAAVGGGVLAMLTAQHQDRRGGAEAAAVQAAKDCVMATQAPDVEAMAASQRRIVECSTGDFAAQAALYSGVLIDAYAAAKAQVEVSNIRAAVERHNDDGSIDVLVAMRVKVTNAAVQNQESGYRLRVQMAPDGDTYKIAALDQVTK